MWQLQQQKQKEHVRVGDGSRRQRGTTADLSVYSSRPHQGFVEHIRPIGCGHKNNPRVIRLLEKND
jgi:hypothetical protein